jgi:ribonuclease BN (tRNA processing enzyme)
MKLELTVLGGAAAWPNPGQGCSSYLTSIDETKLLLDCGPDTLLELRRHTRLDAIDAVIISHCHSDHILDLIALRYALVYSRESNERRLPLWMPPGGTAVIRALGEIVGSQGEKTGDFWDEVFDVREYAPSDELKIGSSTVRFAPTQHFIECFAIAVGSPEDATIVYGADTGGINELSKFARNADILISEATADSHEGVDPEARGHLTPEEAGRWASASSVSRLLLTHLWHERDDREVVRRAATEYEGPIDVAKPGLKLYV